MKRLIVTGLALLALAACGSHSFGSGTTGTTSTTTDVSTSGGGVSGVSGDASANLACTHFRDVAQDAANGILTSSELRGKLQEVYNDAKYSDSPGIPDGALRMLRDVTNGDSADMNSAIPAFDQACTAAGY